MSKKRISHKQALQYIQDLPSGSDLSDLDEDFSEEEEIEMSIQNKVVDESDRESEIEEEEEQDDDDDDDDDDDEKNKVLPVERKKLPKKSGFIVGEKKSHLFLIYQALITSPILLKNLLNGLH